MLVLGTWGVMFFMAGMPWLWIIALGAAGVGGAFAAYTIFPHVAGRIDRFLTGEGDTFQVDMGREAIVHGGWFGVGPGEGTVKRVIPDSPCRLRLRRRRRGVRHHPVPALIMFIFAFIVMRGLMHRAEGARRLHALCRGRAGRRVRLPGDHQHGGQSATDAGQGHDAAVHLLWRLLA